MKEIIHNSWQEVLSSEFSKDYYLHLREFLKKELKWKKKEYIKISEDRQVFGYYIKKYKSRVIKPQTTIEK